MSEQQRQFTISISPELAAYAERLVANGKAQSVSEVLGRALTERVERERRARLRWNAIVAEAEADPEVSARVDRMIAHVDAQMRRFEEEHRRS